MIVPMRKTIWVLDDAKASLLIQQGATVTEVAERLKVSRQTVYVAIRKGRIPAPASARLGDSNASTRNGSTKPHKSDDESGPNRLSPFGV